MKTWLIIGIFHLLFLSQAQGNDCPDQMFPTSSIVAQQARFALPLGCTVHLNQKAPSNNDFSRKLSFFGSGRLTVSVMSQASRQEGQLAYYILPVIGLPQLSQSENRFEVRDGSGRSWNMGSDGSLSADCKVAVQNPPHFRNEGGLKVQSCPGRILVEVGFMGGKDPAIARRTLSSKLVDENGNSCNVSNDKLFSYTLSDGRLAPPGTRESLLEARFEYNSVARLSRLLCTEAQCKDLKFEGQLSCAGL